MNDSDDTSHRRHQGSFFGRRKGHKLRDHQTDLVETLLPELAVDIQSTRFADLSFGAPVNALRLEVGFGGGEHLLAEAAAYPDTGFIGCEPYINGMAKILAQIDAQKLNNVRLFQGDAADLIAWLPDRSVTRVDLIHPDPWPKRRHWKRRFVQDRMIDELARIVPSAGQFRFVSDIDDYCAWTLAHFQRRDDFVWTATKADNWRLPWPDYTMTRYGRKATREGRRASYLIFGRI